MIFLRNMENSNYQQIPTSRFSTKDGFFSESSTVNITRIPRQHTDVPSNLGKYSNRYILFAKLQLRPPMNSINSLFSRSKRVI